MTVKGVAAIFGRVLEVGDVGADSDFFALGGDSLLATRVLSAVARDYGVEPHAYPTVDSAFIARCICPPCTICIRPPARLPPTGQRETGGTP